MSNDVNNEVVKLKTFLGIPPRIYIGILFLAAIIFVVYILSFFSFYKFGGHINLDSSVGSAMVFVDDKFIGSTPMKVYLGGGEHKIGLKKDFFKEKITTVNLPYIPFARIFYYKNLNVELELENKEKLILYFEKELFKWTLIKNYNVNYHFPPIFIEVAKSLSKEDFMSFAKENLPLITSKEMLEDLIESLNFHKEDIKKDNPNDLFSYMNNLSQNKLKPEWINNIYGKEVIKEDKKAENQQDNIQIKETDDFLEIEAGTYYFYDDKKITIDKTTRVFKKPVFVNDFEPFFDENPEWDIKNKENLEKENKVDELYLTQNILLQKDTSIYLINFNLADSFVKWYSKKQDKKYVLPDDKILKLLAFKTNYLQDDLWVYSSSFAYTPKDTTLYENPKQENGAFLVKIFKKNTQATMPYYWTQPETTIYLAQEIEK